MKLTIIGASGHGKVIADIARLNGYDAIDFLDDDESVSYCGHHPVVGKTSQAVENDVVVAIGDANIRERLSKNRKLITLVHPNAVIADGVEIGEGTVVMAGVVINAGAKIGRGCIICRGHRRFLALRLKRIFMMRMPLMAKARPVTMR